MSSHWPAGSRSWRTRPISSAQAASTVSAPSMRVIRPSAPRSTSKRCTCASATSRWSAALSLATQWYSRTSSGTGPAARSAAGPATRVTWKFCSRHRCSRRPTRGCTPRTRVSSANSPVPVAMRRRKVKYSIGALAWLPPVTPTTMRRTWLAIPLATSASRSRADRSSAVAGAQAQFRYRSATRTWASGADFSCARRSAASRPARDEFVEPAHGDYRGGRRHPVRLYLEVVAAHHERAASARSNVRSDCMSCSP